MSGLSGQTADEQFDRLSGRLRPGGRVVREGKLSITRSWVQNLSLPDERSNRKTSCRIGFHSVYLVSLQGLPFIQLYFKMENLK